MVRQRGEMLDRRRRVTGRHRVAPPLQQQIHRCRTRPRPFVLYLPLDPPRCLRIALLQLPKERINISVLGLCHRRQGQKHDKCRNDMIVQPAKRFHNVKVTQPQGKTSLPAVTIRR